MSPPSTQEDGGWTPRSSPATGQRLHVGTAVQRVAAGRPEPALRRAPPQLVTPGTRAAPACTASGPGPTSPPSAPRRPLSRRPRGLAGHLRFSVATEATGVWVVPPLGLRDERAALRVTLVPRTGCSRVPCSFVLWWPHQNQRRHQQRSKSLFTETHLPLPRTFPEKAAGQPDPHWAVDWTAQLASRSGDSAQRRRVLPQASWCRRSGAHCPWLSPRQTRLAESTGAGPQCWARGRPQLGTAAGPWRRGLGAVV